MNILFICKYNRFRSKFGEAFFNKLNKNKNHKAKSAGIIRGEPLSYEVKLVAKELGLKLTPKPQGLTSELMRWADTIIIVADNVPEEIFKSRKYKIEVIKWNIKDCPERDVEKIRKVVKEIEKNVKGIIKNDENKSLLDCAGTWNDKEAKIILKQLKKERKVFSRRML